MAEDAAGDLRAIYMTPTPGGAMVLVDAIEQRATLLHS
jgi:hypothetical protein